VNIGVRTGVFTTFVAVTTGRVVNDGFGV